MPMTKDEREAKAARTAAYFDKPYDGGHGVHPDHAVAHPLNYIAAQTYFIRKALERIAEAAEPIEQGKSTIHPTGMDGTVGKPVE